MKENTSAMWECHQAFSEICSPILCKKQLEWLVNFGIIINSRAVRPIRFQAAGD